MSEVKKALFRRLKWNMLTCNGRSMNTLFSCSHSFQIYQLKFLRMVWSFQMLVALSTSMQRLLNVAMFLFSKERVFE